MCFLLVDVLYAELTWDWYNYGFFSPNACPNSNMLVRAVNFSSYPSLDMLLINKLFNSIACLLYFVNLQLVIPGRTWILLHVSQNRV